jgi:hypothetical protein
VSILTLRDGRMYEMRETAFEMFDFLDTNRGSVLYLPVRQPGRKHAHYKGLTISRDWIASIADDGLGHAVLNGIES